MLINFLIFLMALLLFCGLALDAGMLQLRKLQLQHAADAAAIGALAEKGRGNSGWVAAGKADAALNGFADGANGVVITIQSPPASGAYSGDANAIQATVTQSVHPGFMGLVGAGTAVPGSTAVARLSPNPDCVYILGNGSFLNYTFYLQNSSSFTSACNVYLDATSDSLEVDLFNSLTVTGGKSIKIRGSSGTTTIWGSVSPSATFNSPIEADPLAWETAPTSSSCTSTNLYLGFGTTTTLNPGTYCNMTINYATVTFNPGLYLIVGGSTWIGATIHGAGVTFYLTKTSPYSSYGNLTILNSTVTLSAPTSSSSGGIPGIVVWADRNWSNSGNQNITLSSSTAITDGIWYAPNIGIKISNGSLQAANYLGFVTDNLTLSNADVTVPSPNFSGVAGGSPFQGNGTGGLVQ